MLTRDDETKERHAAQTVDKEQSGISHRWGLALDFEHDIEKIFRLLNVDAVRSLLFPSPP